MLEFRESDVSVGAILSGVVRLLRDKPQPALIYIVVLGVLGVLSDYLPNAWGELGIWIQLLRFFVAVITIIGGYLLLEKMIIQSGQLTYKGPRRYFAFLGQSLLIFVGVVLGILILVIPGMILAARWSVAQTLLVGKGEGILDGMRKSWDLTRGYTASIVVAGLVFVIPAFLVGGAIGAMEAEDSLGAIIVAQLVGNGATVLLTAMIVAILKLLPSSDNVANVFD